MDYFANCTILRFTCVRARARPFKFGDRKRARARAGVARHNPT